MSKCVRALILRAGGNYTTTYEVEFADGCVLRKRTRSTYEGASVVARNDPAMRCSEHGEPRRG